MRLRRFSILFIPFALVQLLFFTRQVAQGSPGYEPVLLLFTKLLLSLILLYGISHLIESLPPNRLFRSFLAVILFTLFCGLNAYHFSTGVPVDANLVADNAGISLSFEALTVVFAAFKTVELILWLVFTLAFILFIIIVRPLKERAEGIFILCGSLLTVVVILLIPINLPDEFSLFSKSIISRYHHDTTIIDPGFPLFHKGIAHTPIARSIPASKKSNPNIFLIMIESFNANFVETRSPEGYEYTPTFNRLMQRGVYVERFYGNSVQTCKGQGSTFFSIIPTMRGKLFVSFPDLRIEGFPSLLAQHGYDTVFFQAYHDLTFDNTAIYMKKAGFASVHSFSEYRDKSDNAFTWGWGIEDGKFYRKFFEKLSLMRTGDPGKPVFASLATVGTHIPCDGMPANRVVPIKSPRNIRERYINALSLADAQLSDFFAELTRHPEFSNSMVIITSDHSFPMREHGIYNNEICHYEESFRIPLLLIWDGALKPERVPERAYSQMDIGPTLCDLLGLYDDDNSMAGISIFDRTTPHPVFLVQPYNGTYLEVVDLPFKYTIQLSTGNESMFNLLEDPKEERDLSKMIDPSRLNSYKKQVEKIKANQQLVEENRIRP